MSYAGLCELVAARGWTIVLATQNSGRFAAAKDPTAHLRAIVIYESREAWHELQAPLVTARLDDPPITLDEAAEAITLVLQAGGVA